ncbi:MAG: hypothetical protein E6Q67_14285 [Roseateles sp.]|nr:MAG: hypothetical protein E6Q67_14285 [Roseateles sp.]
MNERQLLGWNMVQQAVEQGRPLDREMQELAHSMGALPSQVEVLSGAMICLIKVVQALKSGGRPVPMFADSAVSEMLERTEARMLNDLDLALASYGKGDAAPLSFSTSALLSMVVAYPGAVVFRAPEPRADLSEQAGGTKPGQRWTGYAIQTVERDANDEITATRTDYYGGRP